MRAPNPTRLYLPRALLTGLASVTIAVTLLVALGQIYSDEQALSILQGMGGALQFLASSVFAALATLMALTLTSVSFLRDLKAERLPPHYLKLVRAIGTLDIIGMGVSICLLLVTLLPSAQEDIELSRQVALLLLYTTVGLLSVLIGIVMMVMLLLQETISTVLSSLPRELVEAIESEVEEVEEQIAERVADRIEKQPH